MHATERAAANRTCAVPYSAALRSFRYKSGRSSPTAGCTGRHGLPAHCCRAMHAPDTAAFHIQPHVRAAVHASDTPTASHSLRIADQEQPVEDRADASVCRRFGHNPAAAGEPHRRGTALIHAHGVCNAKVIFKEVSERVSICAAR